MKIKTILTHSSKVSTPVQDRNKIGKLPEWNLSDLYSGPSAKEIDFDLKQVKKMSDSFTEKYQNNLPIKNLDKVRLEKNEFIFHAGTIQDRSNIFSNGGRVLNFVVKSNEFKICRKKAIQLINQVNWDKGFYRKDIGYKVIDV